MYQQRIHRLIKKNKQMISFEYRILSEYKVKVAKIDTLVKSIMSHREPKSTDSKEASEFIEV